jgi:hypothetical protein
MGYRDDFYKEENILGYTGKLGSNPTVYFADAGGVNPKLQQVGDKQKVVVQFGHITQAHDDPTNVGRERVREAYSYSICNVLDTSVPGLENASGKEIAQECVYGEQELQKIGLEGYETDLTKSRDDQHLDWHVSRNRFESVHAGNRKQLAMAIKKNPEKKQRG